LVSTWTTRLALSNHNDHRETGQIMKKKIWLTSLGKSEEDVQQIMATIKKYGLDINGHFWEDDLEKMAWAAARKEILATDIKMWIIFGTAESFSSPTVIYGLSLLTLSVQATHGLNFPVVLLQEGTTAINLETLPAHFSECMIHQVAKSTWGAKLVAALHKPVQQVFPPYRLDVYGIPQIGQWFEIGPREGVWKGAIFGTSGEGISMHAVGPSGQLPEKSTLNYPQKGLKINLGEKEIDGWAVQNNIDEKSSYYVKVDSHPETIMFCPYSQEDETEAYIIDLK